jgi:hypothetical protein
VSFTLNSTANRAESRCWRLLNHFYNLKKGSQTLTAVENPVSGLVEDLLILALTRQLEKLT